MAKRKSIATTTEEPTSEIVIESNSPDIERVQTGWWSLDRALGGGWPLRTYTEISGWSGSGKSSLAYFALGAINKKGTIGICDTEGFHPRYAAEAASRSGWRGRLKVVPDVTEKGKPATEEQMLDGLADYLYEDDVSAILLDSIGGVSPIGEEEGSVADANMGKRAQIMARFLRRSVHRMRRADTPKILVATNHIHAVMSGRGTTTSGGQAVQYLAATRIRLSKTEEDGGWWVLQGAITKRRYHGTNPINTFRGILIPGYGIHPGLTAVEDCIFLGLATKENVVKMDGVSYGYFKNMVQNMENADLFVPFHAKLALVNQEVTVNEAQAGDSETE